MKPFVDEYLAGRTPIPCTLCNNFIKFDQFLEMAEGVGADRIATGHYAQIRWNPDSGRWEMRRSVDRAKDQTYFLFGLKQDQLARTMFPLGAMEKTAVRELARELGIPTAAKPDSQEICFVPNGDYAGFIDAYFREQGIAPAGSRGRTGDGRWPGGRRACGRSSFHGGPAARAGRRRGRAALRDLDRAGQSARDHRPQQRIADAIDAHVNGVNWISIAAPAAPVRAEVKIRNKHAGGARDAYCRHPILTRVEVRFDEPQRAVTPGQARGVLFRRSGARRRLDRVTALRAQGARLCQGARLVASPRLRRDRAPKSANWRDLQIADTRSPTACFSRSGRMHGECRASFRRSRARMFTSGFVMTAWRTSLPRTRRARACWWRRRISGNWELSAFSHALMTAPMHIVVRPLDNARDRRAWSSSGARCRAITSSKRRTRRAKF